MPNIAQQDYIIIDWEGKSASDAAKKAEVDAQLKNICLANPLALLSVVFKNYDFDSSNGGIQLEPVVGFSIDGTTEHLECTIMFSLSNFSITVNLK